MSRPSEILMDIKSVKAWLTEADYVPVVRCKDCIHFEPFRPTDGFCKISGMINTLEFFCADGERREKND